MSGSALALAAMFACLGFDPTSQPPVMPELSQGAPAPAALVAEQDLPAAETEITAIVITARRHDRAADPLEALNLKAFAVAQAADDAFVAPAAHTYEHVIPEPARMGLRNFFRNLHEPVVFLNFLIQLKPRSAIRTLGRFAVNSSVGAAGLFDMARRKPFHLPYRPNGFANTLAFYGVKAGPFLFLPLIGPTTVRDLIGLAMDTTAMPAAGLRPIPGPGYSVSAATVKALDHRAEDDERIHALRDGNPNAYASIREAYLAKREAEIAELHGIKPTPETGTAELALAAAAAATTAPAR